jgi:hypothetical protein
MTRQPPAAEAVGQGRASFARRAAVGAKRRALTGDGAEGTPPLPPRGAEPLLSIGSPSVTSGCSTATFQTRFSLSCLIPLWFPHSNLKLLYSTRSGVTCHLPSDAKQRGFLRVSTAHMEAPDAARPPPKRRPWYLWIVRTEFIQPCLKLFISVHWK